MDDALVRSRRIAPPSERIAPAKFAHFVLKTARFEEVIEWYRTLLQARIVTRNGMLCFLSYDAIISYWFQNPETGKWGFGIGVGSLVITLNPILIAGYTFGCHSLRHLIGGRFDTLSRRKTQKKAYDCVGCLNRRHMVWAWASLIWVAFCDLYVRMVASGAWHDFRIL